MPWESSDRKKRLPRDWHRVRAIVLKRDRNTCVKCGKPANQVDHINAGDDHSISNLQALCPDCHKAKSSEEGVKARQAKYGKRPPEKHPGYIE